MPPPNYSLRRAQRSPDCLLWTLFQNPWTGDLSTSIRSKDLFRSLQVSPRHCVCAPKRFQESIEVGVGWWRHHGAGGAHWEHCQLWWRRPNLTTGHLVAPLPLAYLFPLSISYLQHLTLKQIVIVHGSIPFKLGKRCNCHTRHFISHNRRNPQNYPL